MRADCNPTQVITDFRSVIDVLQGHCCAEIGTRFNGCMGLLCLLSPHSTESGVISLQTCLAQVHEVEKIWTVFSVGRSALDLTMLGLQQWADKIFGETWQPNISVRAPSTSMGSGIALGLFVC